MLGPTVISMAYIYGIYIKAQEQEDEWRKMYGVLTFREDVLSEV